MTAYQPKRSFLYSPASRIERVRKALETGAADVVVADLEDGTAPSDKAVAREAVAQLLRSLPSTRSLCAIRINAWPTPAARSDLDAILPRPPPAIVVPKVERPAALHDLLDLFPATSRPALYAQIETAKGLLACADVAAAPGVHAVVFGAEDYAADVGAVRTAEGLEVLYARSHIVACAAAAGVEAIDQIWADFKDPAGLARDAAFGARLGYAGKQLIHPDQIGPTHAAYAPSAAEVERARRVVDTAERAGGGVVVVDGRMIDRPLVEQARRVLRRADVA